MNRRLSLIAALCLAAPVAARAQTNTTFNGSLAGVTGPGSVVYDLFNVSQAGTFDIFTMAPHQDAYIYLFAGLPNGGTLTDNPLINHDDDGCSAAQCGPSFMFSNARLVQFLPIGDYSIAYGNFYLSEADARAGFNTGGDDGTAGDFAIRMTSDDGIANNIGGAPLAVTPEPATMGLVATGLVGMMGSAMRRKKRG